MKPILHDYYATKLLLIIWIYRGQKEEQIGPWLLFWFAFIVHMGTAVSISIHIYNHINGWADSYILFAMQNKGFPGDSL